MTELGVAMIGHGFMGAAHSQGWRTAPRAFALDAETRMRVVVGRDADRAREAAARWGWEESSADWRAVLERDDIHIVDIVTPGDSHAELAIAALRAGKHVLLEKPLANTAEEADAIAAAAADAGTVTMTGFVFRRVPAATLFQRLVAEGFVGEIRQVRASYLQDWLSDADAPWVWRLDKSLAGSGALGDIGAHAVDLSQFVTGMLVAEVSGTLATLVPERSGRPVTVDDVALFTARFDSGVLGVFEATRFATGHRNSLRVEVSGSRGAIAFDLADMNALQVYDATAPADRRGFTRIDVTEGVHPYLEGWWPPGHALGYEHGFSHQVRDLVDAIVAGGSAAPDFASGAQVQRVLDAIERSAGDGSAWTRV
ncbi:MAG TPA: Gfo/Idh/MocA family oxidoreductase [Rhodoglobus sp.]|nr:Gfo/Idh/MocA family oxidoreductase [Rhodoglobus sp.]